MAHTAVIAPAFTVLDLLGGERNLIGLARVSTDAQDARLQHDALTGAGCGRIYTEKMSTCKAVAKRQGLAAALDYLRPVTPSPSGSSTASAAPSKKCSPSPTTCTPAASASGSSPASSPAATHPVVRASSSSP